MRVLAIVLALLVWAALSYAFIFVFAGSHVCGILDSTATPVPVDVQIARCNRPDVGAITASVVGLVAIVLVAFRMRRQSPRADVGWRGVEHRR
jgi:hypothetical protein